jgi:hypothetical protein
VFCRARSSAGRLCRVCGQTGSSGGMRCGRGNERDRRGVRAAGSRRRTGCGRDLGRGGRQGGSCDRCGGVGDGGCCGCGTQGRRRRSTHSSRCRRRRRSSRGARCCGGDACRCRGGRGEGAGGGARDGTGGGGGECGGGAKGPATARGGRGRGRRRPRTPRAPKPPRATRPAAAAGVAVGVRGPASGLGGSALSPHAGRAAVTACGRQLGIAIAASGSCNARPTAGVTADRMD